MNNNLAPLTLIAIYLHSQKKLGSTLVAIATFILAYLFLLLLLLLF
jgi:hypothetical protein